jgi:hypothetical protein
MAKAKPAASKGSKKAPSAPAVLVTPIAVFQALKPAARCETFAEKDRVNRVSFSELGKLHVLISEDIAADNAAHPKRKPRTIYDELRKLGVRDSSISNASYAARAWNTLVSAELITELQFDALTFQDCFKISRAMSHRSALQLDAAAVAELINKQPDDFDVELACLYEHGITAEEKRAKDEQAEAQRLQAQLAEAQRQQQQQQSAKPRPATPPASETPTTPSAIDDTGETSMPAEPSTETPAPAAPTTTPSERTTEGPPMNVTPMPDASLPAMLDVLNDIRNEAEALTAEGRAMLAAALREAADAIDMAAVETAAA